MGRLPDEPVREHISTKAVRLRRTITKQNVKWFKYMESRRALRQQQVWALLRDLFDGKPFHLPISVNRVKSGSGKERFEIIDGQHRIAAIEEFINRVPNGKVELEIHVYSNLTDEEARKVYDELNQKVVKQSLPDKLATHALEIPVLVLMRKDFPAPVHMYAMGQSQKGFQVSTLLSAWMARHKWGIEGGGLVEGAKALSVEDYGGLCSFAQAWMESFGEPTRDNPWARSSAMQAMCKVYAACAAAGLKDEEIVKRWRVLAKDSFIVGLTKSSSLSHIKTLTNALMDRINGGRWKTPVVFPAQKPVEDSKE